ncbi:MAG: CBS domain-containing protein [Holophagales bacterium]|nr:CBS domain-containing protein [Holophagales bacterium]
MDPLEFLIRHAPFDTLSPAGREQVGSALEITWARVGEALIRRSEANPYLYAIRKGQVRVELDGQRIVDLGPGELFGLTSLSPDAETPLLDVQADADCLLYRLHRDTVSTLCEAEPAFARFFLDSLSRRLRRLADSQAVTLTSDLGRRVGDLVRREPVTLALDGVSEGGSAKADDLTPSEEITAGEVARVMESARVSSVLLTEGENPQPAGIVTDRDLRGKVLARGLGVETPVREIMTSPVECLEASTPGAEALLYLLRSGRHHLVLEEEGRLAGVVTQSDLLRQHLESPAALLERIRSARRKMTLTRVPRFFRLTKNLIQVPAYSSILAEAMI